jgi:hypothetical protein
MASSARTLRPLEPFDPKSYRRIKRRLIAGSPVKAARFCELLLGFFKQKALAVDEYDA